MSQIKLRIVQKLVPGLQKPGYMEEAESMGASSSANPPAEPRSPPYAPDRDGSRSRMPGFPRNPLEIGRSDLDPFPVNPFAPPSVFPHAGGMGCLSGLTTQSLV